MQHSVSNDHRFYFLPSEAPHIFRVELDTGNIGFEFIDRDELRDGSEAVARIIIIQRLQDRAKAVRGHFKAPGIVSVARLYDPDHNEVVEEAA